MRLERFLRLDNFTMAFCVISVLGSFFGEFLYKRFGLYGERTYDHSTYFYIFSIFIVSAACMFNLMNNIQRKRRGNVLRLTRTENVYSLETQVLVFILVAANMAFIPFQLIYLKHLYSSVSHFYTLDEARIDMQSSIPLVHRFFWYSSMLMGLSIALIVLNAKFRFRRLLRYLAIIQSLLLILYGSKFLFVAPMASACLTLYFYRRMDASPGKIVRYSVAVGLIIILSTVYTTYRSSGKMVMAESIIVDVFATFMPEQRDAAFLIGRYGDSLRDKDYLADNLTVLAASVTTRRFVELFGTDIDDITEKMTLNKALMGYEFRGMPRIGIIGDSYINAGMPGAVVNLAALILLLSLMYRLIHSRRGTILDRYFLISIFFNVLWTFNSNFILTLPYIFTILYFYVFLRIALEIMKTVSAGGRWARG